MKISSGSVSLAAAFRRTESVSVEERLRVWANAPVARMEIPKDKLSLSSLARPAPPPRGKSAEGDSGLRTRDQVVELILEKFFGVRRRVMTEAQRPTAAAEPPTPVARNAASVPQTEAGLEYQQTVRRTSEEQLSVRAGVQVTTADGRQLDVSLALEQSRQVVQEQRTEVRLGSARKVDPLALDLNGDGVRLDAQKMSFDLNADGSAEQISRLSAGDAWLARDINGNGHIDDGQELFGPKTGSGFQELAQLDSDGDGFIDEDDEQFGALRLWRPDDAGGGTLRTLAEEGVGAIAVASVHSPFELSGGSIRETGVYLKENGTAGAVQHVDLEV